MIGSRTTGVVGWLGLWAAFRLSRRSARLDPDLSLLGAVLVACILGFLLAMAMGGFGPAPGNFAIIVIGLAVTFARLGLEKETASVKLRHQLGAQSRWPMKKG